MRPIIALFCLLLTACGADAPKPAKRIDTPQEAVVRDGDVTLRANVVLTGLLQEGMAREYGILRDDHSVMLMVSVRRGPEGLDLSLPATVTASVTDLRGQTRQIAMREMRVGELTDHIGTTEVSPPDTLRFDVKIVRDGGAASTMTFSRDFTGQ
jgi:Domain of unknown function (DUF4426)